MPTPAFALRRAAAPRKSRRWRYGLLGLALLGLGAWLAGLAAIDQYGQQDQAQPAEAIIILGARVYPGGVAGPSLTRRTQHAAALYQRGLAPYLICSGGVGENPPAEAVVAGRLAQQLGVPAAALLYDDRSTSTEESAQNTAALMRARGWTRAIVVSDSYHLYRARLLFQQAGVTAYPSPAQATAGPLGLGDRVGYGSRELAALLWYWGKGLLGLRWTSTPF